MIFFCTWETTLLKHNLFRPQLSAMFMNNENGHNLLVVKDKSSTKLRNGCQRLPGICRKPWPLHVKEKNATASDEQQFVN